MSTLFFPVISAIINRPVGIAEATHLTCVPLYHKHLASVCHQVPKALRHTVSVAFVPIVSCPHLTSNTPSPSATAT